LKWFSIGLSAIPIWPIWIHMVDHPVYPVSSIEFDDFPSSKPPFIICCWCSQLQTLGIFKPCLITSG
jgi:hypothetical protein